MCTVYVNRWREIYSVTVKSWCLVCGYLCVYIWMEWCILMYEKTQNKRKVFPFFSRSVSFILLFFVSDWRDLTLDPDTAYPELGLSQDCTEATYIEHPPPVPDHPERFDYWEEVLCSQGLEGRCYWELEWRGQKVCIAVSYKGVGRKGGSNDSRFGMNQLSWTLDCSDSGFSFWHNNEHTDIKAPPSSRIGVFLDHKAGSLSFYNISDSVTLIHRVQTTFTEPLYAGFEFYNYGDHVKLCHLKSLT